MLREHALCYLCSVFSADKRRREEAWESQVLWRDVMVDFWKLNINKGEKNMNQQIDKVNQQHLYKQSNDQKQNCPQGQQQNISHQHKHLSNTRKGWMIRITPVVVKHMCAHTPRPRTLCTAHLTRTDTMFVLGGRINTHLQVWRVSLIEQWGRRDCEWHLCPRML